MGCDIHFVVERKCENGWLGLFDKYNCKGVAGQRDYGLFGQLAGVRWAGTKGRTPKGVPEDSSQLTRYHVNRDGSDGHSHSFLSMAEFVDAVRSVEEIRKHEPYFDKAWQRESPVNALFNIYVADEHGDDRDGGIEEYRVVFWFDN